MKTKLTLRVLVSLCLFCSALIATENKTEGATVSAFGSELGVPAVPTSTIGSDGYVFYATGGNGGPGTPIFTGLSAANPVSYVTIAGGNGTYGDTSYSLLTINGTIYRTGVLYQSPVVQGSSGTIATLSLTSGTPASFILTVLEDNASAAANNMSFLTVSDSNSASQAVAGNGGGVSNDFYSFLISNAAPGDTITISVTNNGFSDGQSHWVIGGLAFESVPEPASWAGSILLLGYIGLRASRLRHTRVG